MSQILVKIDPSIEIPEISMPLEYTSADESGSYTDENHTDIMQTKVIGIMTPIIAVNETVINFTDIINMSLKNSDIYPTLTCTIIDRHNLLRDLNPTYPDNSLQLILVPPFDGAYKKISIVFYITNIYIKNQTAYISAKYKLPAFTDSLLKSFGNISIYTLCEKVCGLTSLGFATNVTESTENTHYVYASNKSIEQLLQEEKTFFSAERNIYNFWIDFWHHLVLVDEYERYNSQDTDEEMMVWVGEKNYEMGMLTNVKPIKIAAVITNHPFLSHNELAATSYHVITRPSISASCGSDNVITYYDDELGEYLDILLQDGDTKKDIFVKYEYLGEDFSNILLSNAYYNKYTQKMSIDTIEITIGSPALCLMRGSKINFLWYKTDQIESQKEQDLIDLGVISEPTPFVEDDESIETPDETMGQLKIDNVISGQYYIIKTELRYENGEWKNILTCGRPFSQKNKLIDIDEDE